MIPYITFMLMHKVQTFDLDFEVRYESNQKYAIQRKCFYICSHV